MEGDREAALAVRYTAEVFGALPAIAPEFRVASRAFHDGAFVASLGLFRAGLARPAAPPMSAGVIVRAFHPGAEAPPASHVWAQALLARESGRLRQGAGRASLTPQEFGALCACADLALASNGFGYSSPL